MHEILTSTRANLTERAAVLEALIKDGEEQCQAIADEGNRQIKVITDKAGADIGGINADLEKHVTELAGVQHSIGTIDAITSATHSESPKVTPFAGKIYTDHSMTEAEAGAAMRRLQQEDQRQLAADPYTTFIGGGGLPEKKKP